MENYIVSARKYRPMTFDTVVGQHALTTTLKNAVKSGKLAHAYLFCGPRGVGKTTCARIFAKAINCMTPTADGEACNECESCKAFNEQRSLNIFELDAASNNSVENIKALMEQTRIPPQVGRYKVFLIEEVLLLSSAAFNAFLKTLEEPPAHVVFILATTEKHKILPTILSRCQIYDFERMTVENTIAHLKMVAAKEGISYEESALALIAEKADGGMRDALSIFDQAASFCQGNITYDKVLEDLNELDADNYFRMVDLAMENKVSDLMLLLNSIIEKGFDGGNVVTGLASHIRNVLMAKDESTLKLLETSKEQTEKFKAQAQKCPTRFLYQALKVLNQCDVCYKQSSNKRLLVELTLIEVAQLTQPDDGVSAGRGPKRLKILFKRLIDSHNQAAAQVAAGERPLVRKAKAAAAEGDGAQASHNATATTPSGNAATATATATATAAHGEAATNAAMGGPGMGAATATMRAASETAGATAGTAGATSGAVGSASGAAASPQPTAGMPRLKLGSLGMTFAGLKHKEEEVKQAEEEEIKNKEEATEFTEDQLSLEWLRMCNRMPSQMTGLAQRMKNIQPTILSYPDIEILVDNKLLLDQLGAIKGRIRASLAAGLHNGSITVSLRLAKQNEIKPLLTKKQIFDKMKKDYKPFALLVDGLGLELG
uniref:DNA polymerase III subunit gamma/tau n=1 Tax=Prevotella sp. TaxID=59823 RepID=UPI0040278581